MLTKGRQFCSEVSGIFFSTVTFPLGILCGNHFNHPWHCILYMYIKNISLLFFCFDPDKLVLSGASLLPCFILGEGGIGVEECSEHKVPLIIVPLNPDVHVTKFPLCKKYISYGHPKLLPVKCIHIQKPSLIHTYLPNPIACP